MKRIVSFLLIASAAAFNQVANAQHISVGAAIGTPFSGGISDFTLSGVDTVSHTFSNSNNYLVGPMVDVRLPLNLGFEVDVLFRPVNVTTDSTVIPNLTRRSSNDYASWEFPVLGKYRLPFVPAVKPFVEAGPSFRAKSSSLSYLSGKGFTIGGGVEVKILRLRIAPALRYTHWGAGATLASPGSGLFNAAATPTNQNQGEFLVGFSF